MKKVTILGIVLVLLAVSVVPVLAKDPPNGNGNGNAGNAGQGNSAGVNPGGTDPVNQQEQVRHANNGGNGNHGQAFMRTPFYLQGVISAVDAGAKTITVTLTHGNAKVKQFIGLDLTIQATDATLIYQVTQDGDDDSADGESVTPTLSSSEGDGDRVAIPFEQLAVGQNVAIHGRLVDSVFTARLITVYIQMTVSESAGG